MAALAASTSFQNVGLTRGNRALHLHRSRLGRHTAVALNKAILYLAAPKLARSTTMALEKELATYQHKLPGLLADEGKFVLIHGDDVAGIWDTYEEAVNQGYKQFGLKTFLVKRIEWVETVQNFTRDFLTCQPSTSHKPRWADHPGRHSSERSKGSGASGRETTVSSTFHRRGAD